MRRACARSGYWLMCIGRWPRPHKFEVTEWIPDGLRFATASGMTKSTIGLFQRTHQPGIWEAGGGAAVLCLPVADGAPRLEARQAVGTADIVAFVLQRPLQTGDVGAVKLVHRAP